MPLQRWTQTLLPVIEAELERVVAQTRQPGLEEMYSMLAYHMGWEGEGAGVEARGKRIRPLLVLLAASAAGGEWSGALPAAAAVELLHNFSLIHDDIQDHSPMRRGRQTVWKRWGVPQAVNVGDTMFTLAQIALLRLEATGTPAVALQAMHILQEASLALTQGQYLDLAYEGRGDLSLEAYWPMVSGKTAALLSACTQLGALCALAEAQVCESYRRFGRTLGLAFQVQDDYLGIWGIEALTGKSAESDLLTGKKSLPVLYGLSKQGSFARRWAQGSLTPEEVPGLAVQLELEGAKAFVQEQANQLTGQALEILEEADPKGEAGQALVSLARKLLSRQG